MKTFRQTLIAAMLALTTTVALAGAPEKAKVSISVGSSILNYLPLPLTVSLGNFKQEGLDVTVENFQAGGSKALQALVAGSTDAVVGFFDHTVQMQAQGKEVVGVILLNNVPGLVMGVRSDLPISSGKDLKGLKVGVTTPGSSTDTFARYYVTRSGLSTKDVSFIGVGSGAPGMTALERKEVDALVYFDPVATMVEKRKTAKPLVDTRNASGAVQAFGGNYPTACLYTTRKFIEQNPETVQRMVNAFLRTLKWMAASPPEAIADKTPKNELLGDKALFTEALRNSRGIFSTDGLFNEQDAMIPVKVLGSYDEKIAKANIDIKKTFTNQFVLVAQKQVK